MAQTTRIIARLELKSAHIIKGIRMEGLRRVGTPGELAARYARQGADEIILEDIVASLYDRPFDPRHINAVAQNAYLPLSFGGRIQSVKDAMVVLRAGADKIAVNSAALNDPTLIDRLTASIGAQSVVGLIQAKRRNGGGWEPMWLSGRERSHRDLHDWAQELQARGAGEIVVLSVDQDGAGLGPDIEAVKTVCDAVTIPVIAGSGISETEDAVRLVFDAGANAVSISQVLHFKKLTIADIKNELTKRGAHIRPVEVAA